MTPTQTPTITNTATPTHTPTITHTPTVTPTGNQSDRLVDYAWCGDSTYVDLGRGVKLRGRHSIGVTVHTGSPTVQVVCDCGDGYSACPIATLTATGRVDTWQTCDRVWVRCKGDPTALISAWIR